MRRDQRCGVEQGVENMNQRTLGMECVVQDALEVKKTEEYQITCWMILIGVPFLIELFDLGGTREG